METNEIIKILKSKFSLKKNGLIKAIKQTGLKNREFKNLDMTDMDLQQFDFEGSSFYNCDFTGTNFNTGFKKCTFVNCKFDNSKHNSERLFFSMGDALFKNCNFNNITITYSYAVGAKFEDTTFTKSRITYKSNFTKSQFVNVKFINSNIDSWNGFGESIFNNVEFDNCDITNNQFHKCAFDNVNIKNCYCAHSTFYDSTFKSSELKNSTFENVVFAHIKAPNLKITDTTIGFYMRSGEDAKCSTMSFSNLNGAIISGSEFNIVSMYGANLQNATISESRIFMSTFGGSGSSIKNAKFIDVDMSRCVCIIKSFKTKDGNIVKACNVNGAKFKNIYCSNEENEFTGEFYNKSHTIQFCSKVKPENRYPHAYFEKDWRDVKHLIIKK